MSGKAKKREKVGKENEVMPDAQRPMKLHKRRSALASTPSWEFRGCENEKDFLYLNLNSLQKWPIQLEVLGRVDSNRSGHLLFLFCLFIVFICSPRMCFVPSPWLFIWIIRRNLIAFTSRGTFNLIAQRTRAWVWVWLVYIIAFWVNRRDR